jgi:hypothetical protein
VGCDIDQPLGVGRSVLRALARSSRAVRTEPQLVEQPFEAVVDRFPWAPVASIAIVSTPASLNHEASSPRPLAVVANDCLVTSTGGPVV